MPSAAGKPPPKKYHFGDLREALIKGAETLLANEGVDACTLRAVARAIGVSQAAPYHHFADKEDLIDAVVVRGYQRLAREQEAAMAAAQEGYGKLRANGVAYVAFAVREPAVFRLMFGRDFSRESFQSRYRPIADESYVLFAGACRSARTFASTGEELEFQLSAWSLVHGLAQLLVEQRIGEIGPAIVGEKPGAVLGEALVERLAGRVIDTFVAATTDSLGAP